MSNIVRKSIAHNVSFSNIKEERFKTVKLSVTMFVPLAKETAAAYALLPSVLVHSCKKYPTAIEFNRELSNLYGAGIGAYCRKMGEALAVTITVAGIDDRYTMNKEKISSELVEFLCEVIFNPNAENEAFAKEDFEQCKRQLLEAIDGEFNEKRSYAISQMIEEMCRDEKFGIKRYGSRKAVEELTPSGLFRAWKEILANSRVEIMFIGNSDTSSAENIFREKFGSMQRTIPDISTEVSGNVGEVKQKTEVSDVAQAKLVMGFRTGFAQPEYDSIPMSLTTAILGGTPNSKFFMNIREKLSLCYYCAARYDKLKGIVTVDSGVERENIERTIQEVLNQLAEMQKGNITDFEIESAKLAIINSYKSALDTVSGTEGWYIGQMLDNKILTVDEAVDELKKVDRNTIVELANTIKLDTIYILQPKSAEEAEV